jgi:hypothetical protein
VRRNQVENGGVSGIETKCTHCQTQEQTRQNSTLRRDRSLTRGADYFALGQTAVGRYLFIVFIRKRSNKALVLTARDMTHREKRGHRGRK